MRCGLKRNAWFKDFEKRSFSKDRTIEGRQVKIDLDPNVGKGRYRIDADGDGFRISAFDEECAQAAIRELCAKLRGESAAEDIVEIKAEQLPGERGGLMRKIRTNGGE